MEIIKRLEDVCKEALKELKNLEGREHALRMSVDSLESKRSAVKLEVDALELKKIEVKAKVDSIAIEKENEIKKRLYEADSRMDKAINLETHNVTRSIELDKLEKLALESKQKSDELQEKYTRELAILKEKTAKAMEVISA